MIASTFTAVPRSRFGGRLMLLLLLGVADAGCLREQAVFDQDVSIDASAGDPGSGTTPATGDQPSSTGCAGGDEADGTQPNAGNSEAGSSSVVSACPP